MQKQPQKSKYIDLDDIRIQRERELLHPVLGELVLDLGYKSVYVTSVRALLSAPIWERQRTLTNRAAHIADMKVAKGTAHSLAGSIVMYRFPSVEAARDSTNGRVVERIGIVDGQHRAASLILLSQRGHWEEMKRNVLVEVFNVTSEDDIVTLFKEINSAEPVKLIDMPDEVSIPTRWRSR